MSRPTDDERFLDEAVARGLLSRERADDVRRLAAALAEVEVALTVDEVLARKGYLSRERSAELRRALARQRVGRYEVIERLGEGGSGVVWKARDVTLDRLVALKLLQPGARDDPAWRERFLREARTAVALNHAGIVRGLDCGEADGYLYFAMEFVPGESLAARLRREGRLPEADAVRIALEVAHVLRYVASIGVVHRDLKPDNVLLTPDGRVKVCDLGLAKPTLELADRGAAEALVAGTPLYVAPEQIRRADRVDWRADVYSLGATLYHLLAGRPPFPWEKGRDLLQRHLDEAPPSPREFAMDVSPHAAAVVLKMLQKDPADRYARPEDLEEDLESVLAGRPPRHTISFAQKERPQVDAAAARAAAVRRGPRWVAAVAVLAALGLVAVASVLFAVNWIGMTGLSGAAQPPRPPRPGEPRDAQPPAASPVDAPGPAVAVDDSPAEAAGRRALETARKVAQANPQDFGAKRDAFQFVADRHPGTASAEIARGIVAALDAERQRAAEEASLRAARTAGVADAEGRFGDAAKAWDEIAVRFVGTQSAEQAAMRATELRRRAAESAHEALDRAIEAAGERDFEAARRHLREAERAGAPEADREIAASRASVEAAAAALESDRSASRAAYERTWGAAVLTAGDEGVEVALGALEAAARAELRAWAPELDALRIDLMAMARAPVSLPSTPSPLDLRAAWFDRLSRRDLAGAESLVPALDGAGVPAAELREGIARVRAVLTATADELLVLSEAARAAGRADDATRLVRRALDRVPGYLRARVVAAALETDAGRSERAIPELEAILALPAPPAEAHLRLGQALAQTRSGLERAQREFEVFLALAGEADPLRAEARAALEAVAAQRAADRRRDLRAEMSAARTRGDTARVVAAGEALVALGEPDGATLVALADAYSESDRPHDAYLAYRRVLDARPQDREWPKAQSGLRRLEQHFPPGPRDRDDLAAARVELDTGSLAKARDDLEAIVRRAPFLEDALAAAAEAWMTRRGSGAYLVSDDPRRALRLAEVLAARNPRHLRGNEVRAAALLRLGRAREALDLAVACLAEDPARPDPATTAGFASLALDEPSAALDHLKVSLQRRRTPQALYGRALAWERMGKRQAARDEAAMLVEEFGVPGDMELEVRGLLARLDLEVEDRPR